MNHSTLKRQQGSTCKCTQDCLPASQGFLFDFRDLWFVSCTAVNPKFGVGWSTEHICRGRNQTINGQGREQAEVDADCKLVCLLTMQAWLVPHDPEETARTACGLRSGPSVHSGFSASWQKALKKAVCSLIQKAVSDADHASKMRLLITGSDRCLLTNL